MIKTVADRRTQELFEEGRARGIPEHIANRVRRKLDRLNTVSRLDELRVPAGNRLHALHGDREGQWAIAVNERWRICFRFADGDAYEVEFCDYH